MTTTTGAPDPAVEASDPVSGRFLVDLGYALAGSSFATGFAADDAQRDQLELLDVFESTLGRPQRTLTWGDSLGGLVAVQLAERAPARIDSAVSLCGVLSGGGSARPRRWRRCRRWSTGSSTARGRARIPRP